MVSKSCLAAAETRRNPEIAFFHTCKSVPFEFYDFYVTRSNKMHAGYKITLILISDLSSDYA